MSEEATPLGCTRVEPLLDAYIDGELDAARAQLVAPHLMTCARCSEEVAACSAAANALRTALDLPPPEHLWTLVEAELRARRGRAWAWRLALAAAALAASVAIALVLAPARNADPRLASAAKVALKPQPVKQHPTAGPPQGPELGPEPSPPAPPKRTQLPRRHAHHPRVRKLHAGQRRYVKPAPMALARADQPVLVVVSEPADPQPQPSARELSASYKIAVSPDPAGPDGLESLNVAKQYGPNGDLQRLDISFTLPGNLVASPMEGKGHDEDSRKGSIDIPDNWTIACSR